MEAQIASLKAQTSQSYSSTSRLEEDELSNKLLQHNIGEDYFFAREVSITQSSVSNTNMNPEVMLHHEDVLLDSNSFRSSQHSYTSYDDNQFSFTTDDNSSCTMNSLDLQANAMRSTYHNMDDLHSLAFGYLNCA